jgi:hypothetical protein
MEYCRSDFRAALCALLDMQQARWDNWVRLRQGDDCQQGRSEALMSDEQTSRDAADDYGDNMEDAAHEIGDAFDALRGKDDDEDKKDKGDDD